jgi:hypothetical protein
MTEVAAEQERDTLIDTCFNAARVLLDRQGGFHGFGRTLTSDGVTATVSIDPQDFSDGQELFRALLARLRAEASSGELRAAAACAHDPDARVVRVWAEHEGADPAAAVAHYTESDGLHTLSQPQVATAKAGMFP